MITLPRLFTDQGELIDIDTSGLSAPLLALLETVRAEYKATQDAERAFADACTEFKDAELGVTVTKEYHDAHFPPQKFYDLWRETFKGNGHG